MPALGKLRHKDHEIEPNLGYRDTVSKHQNNNNNVKLIEPKTVLHGRRNENKELIYININPGG